MKRLLSVFIIVILAAQTISVQAQRRQLYGARFTKKKHYWSYGGTLGGSAFAGDIAPQNSLGSIDLGETKGSIGFFAMKRFLPRLSYRVGFNYIAISGDDNNLNPPTLDTQTGQYVFASEEDLRWKRNLHFRNRIYEFQAQIIIDLFPNRGVYYARPKSPVPYLSLGLSVGYHNPQAIAPETDQWGISTGAGGEWVDLRPLKTEGQDYSSIVFGLPVGIGARYQVSSRMDIAFEMQVRLTQNDYLDDVSGTYADPATLDSPLARALSDRSLEETAAQTEESRNIGDANVRDIVGVQNFNGYPMGNGFIPGEARGGEFSLKGSGTPYDTYMTFGFHAYYIVPNGVTSTAKFGRRSNFGRRKTTFGKRKRRGGRRR